MTSTNMIWSRIITGKVSSYVDDTIAIVSAPTAQQLAIKIQTTSESIEQYLNDNLLKVNTEKSKLLVNSPNIQEKVSQ